MNEKITIGYNREGGVYFKSPQREVPSTSNRLPEKSLREYAAHVEFKEGCFCKCPLSKIYDEFKEDWVSIELVGTVDAYTYDFYVERIDVVDWRGMPLELLYSEQEEIVNRLRAGGSFGERIHRVEGKTESLINAIVGGAPYSLSVGPGEKDGEVVVDISVEPRPQAITLQCIGKNYGGEK